MNHSMTLCHCQSSGNQGDRFTHLWGPQPEEKPKDDEEKDEEKEEKDNAAGWDVLDVTWHWILLPDFTSEAAYGYV